MRETDKIVTEDGWEAAYRSQAAGVVTGAEFLWQEPPIPYLDNPDLVAHIRASNVVRVLDAGAGDGRNSLALERLGFFVVGADSAATAVTLATDRANRHHHNRVVFVHDDITRLRVAGPFDLVLCADTLGQLSEPSIAIGEFSRVLRPGGVLLFNVYTKQDGTYGVGTQLDEWTFDYKGCLFRYFNERMVLDLVDGWDDVRINVSTWVDPPHGAFRPEPHVHHSYVVWAKKPGGRS